MRVQPECLPCIEQLTRQTIRLGCAQSAAIGADEKRIAQKMIRYLRRDFSPATVPAELFTRINRLIKQQTRVPDAFRNRKREEIAQARTIAREVFAQSRPRNLEQLLLFSVKGNSLDFFRPLKDSVAHMRGNACFAVSHIAAFRRQLRQPRHILFFADNAGECFFDAPLLSKLNARHRISYIVKSEPIQNDATLADIRTSKIKTTLPSLRGTGNDAVGIEYKSLAPAIKCALSDCDLIIAKGMGYYETFTELADFRPKVFHLLMAKCRPVAKHIGVPLNSYVLLGP